MSTHSNAEQYKELIDLAANHKYVNGHFEEFEDMMASDVYNWSPEMTQEFLRQFKREIDARVAELRGSS